MRKIYTIVTLLILSSCSSSKPDPVMAQKGLNIYLGHCAGCHGFDGEGLAGPNLTDNYSIHGSSRKDMTKIINEGNIITGMPGWKQTFTEEEIANVVEYLQTLKGKNIEGKEPEGTLNK